MIAQCVNSSEIFIGLLGVLLDWKCHFLEENVEQTRDSDLLEGFIDERDADFRGFESDVHYFNQFQLVILNPFRCWPRIEIDCEFFVEFLCLLILDLLFLFDDCCLLIINSSYTCVQGWNNHAWSCLSLLNIQLSAAIVFVLIIRDERLHVPEKES